MLLGVIKMNFDVKNVKSWYNRHDVKVGDEGYLSCDISTLREKEEDAEPTKLDHIYDNKASCFSSIEYFADYPFFLPLNAVKKEKRYRPFEDLYEFYKFLSIAPFPKGDFCRDMLLKFSFTYREKSLPQYATTTVINRIDFNTTKDPCLNCINNRDFEDWFDNYEIMNNKGEWQPFGAEVEND